MKKCRVVAKRYFGSKIKIRSSYRSSRPEAFCKKGVLRNFAKFTGKHLCLTPVNFVKFLRTPFLIEHLWWLLLWLLLKSIFTDKFLSSWLLNRATFVKKKKMELVQIRSIYLF